MTAKKITLGWTPKDMAKHYGVPKHLDGKGVTLAVIDMGETIDKAELAKDFKALGLDMPDLQVIDLEHRKSFHPDPAIETHIDVEVIASVCPAAKIKIYQCKLSFMAMATAIEAACKDDVDVISISWGAPEGHLHSGEIYAIETALTTARNADITVCVASGDAGASGLVDSTTHAVINDNMKSVNCVFPASSPDVLACGGTSMIEDSKGARSEVVWNNTATQGRASGGGVSSQFKKPGWQAHIDIPSADTGHRIGRILPDVAALASVGDWVFYDRNATKDPEGGTSAVAPFYAGLIALAVQERRSLGKARLGCINAHLPALAKQGVFTDITKGDNKVAPGGKGYEAQTGFDACTGYGVPQASKLVAALVALP